MSNTDGKVTITRWWWVRHAPVRNDGGNIYGQTDLACDTSDTEVFDAVAKILPRKGAHFPDFTADLISPSGFGEELPQSLSGWVANARSVSPKQTYHGSGSRRACRS